ncbi:MAG TPA: histidine kinase [Candidatus Binataceae bacterium]|nr:histidine kinase [Candidatus Binataceae bacterium]
MEVQAFSDFDLDIARIRIVLSLLAMLSLYMDPFTAGGLFHLEPWMLATLLCHLTYSVGTYFLLEYQVAKRWLPAATTVLDLLFAMGIAYLTQGRTSPSYIFFVFAIIAVGVRGTQRAIIRITLCGVALYLLAIFVAHGLTGAYAMRAVYLAIAGYLVGFFAQQRANHEDRGRELEAQAERHSIARLLHDSYVQSLAGVNLRLETCRELLRRGRPDDATRELNELQLGVKRQFDEVREYVRSLAGVDSNSTSEVADITADPKIQINGVFNGSSRLGERILQIMLEGLRNARKHARASSVRIDASEIAGRVLITIADDGVGFPPASDPPWTIASHVAETGGRLRFSESGPACLQVEIPKL